MIFTKLELKNFKPYRDTEIPLFSEERGNKNMTVNVGQTGAGKTTISEALLWCLYGDTYLSQYDVELEEWLNESQKSIARKRGENDVQIQVSLSIKLENNEKYRIVRSNTFLLDEGVFNKEKLNVIHQGESINGENFIDEHFVNRDLMEYFVFDAEQVLEQFNEDRKGTIRDNLYDLIGIERFDDVEDVLKELTGEDGYIQEKISKKKTKLAPSDVQQKVTELRKTKEDIREDMKKAKEERKKLKGKKESIFQGEPSEDVKTFDNLKTKEENLRSELEELIQEYKTTKFDDLQSNISDRILKNLDYLFLEDVVKSGLEKLQSSSNISLRAYKRAKRDLSTALREYYSGIYFSSEGAKAIDESSEINKKDLINEEQLLGKLEEGEDRLNESKSRREFDDALEDIGIVKEKFNKFQKKHQELRKKIIGVRNKINNLQDTAEREEDREKLRNYEKYEKKIEEKEQEIKEYKEKIDKLKDKINEKENKYKTVKDKEEEIGKLEVYEGWIEELIELTKDSKDNYTKDLLNEINKLASNFLRSVSDKVDIYNSIEVNSKDYSFTVLNKEGREVSPHQFNRGNRQIALMAFFISISSYLAKHQDKKIPYVIDNPLFRLDPGHDKRLLKELSTIRDQIVLHLIPEKEYRPDKFNMFSINTQNWIEIESDLESNIESMPPSKPIDYDVDEF